MLRKIKKLNPLVLHWQSANVIVPSTNLYQELLRYAFGSDENILPKEIYPIKL